MQRLALPLFLAPILGVACGDGGGGIVIGEAVENCAFTEDINTLDGTVWVMDESTPEGNRDNPAARFKFFKEDGKQKVKYTVKSATGVYTYDCRPTRGDTEWECMEKPRVKDWCQTMEVYEPESCRLSRMKEMGAEGWLDDAEISKQIDEAKKTVAGKRGTDDWNTFRNMNHNMGNKLRGMLFVKPNVKKCNARVDDMYMTIYQGQKLEDSNPVGTNAFNLSKDEFLWEHCDSGTTLADAQTAEKPPVEEMAPGKFQHETGKEIYYHYYGDKALEPEDGCTYSYDAYAQWRPVGKDNKVQAGEDGKLVWGATHTFKSDDHPEWFNPAIPQGFFSMVRYKTCGGNKEKIDTICNAAKVQNVEG